MTILNVTLYVKREEVIDLCIKSYCDPPPCWTPKKLQSPEAADNDDENKGWYDKLTDQRKKKIQISLMIRFITIR